MLKGSNEALHVLYGNVWYFTWSFLAPNVYMQGPIQVLPAGPQAWQARYMPPRVPSLASNMLMQVLCQPSWSHMCTLQAPCQVPRNTLYKECKAHAKVPLHLPGVTDSTTITVHMLNTLVDPLYGQLGPLLSKWPETVALGYDPLTRQCL